MFIIFGKGPLGLLLYEYLTRETDEEVLGFSCDEQYIDSKKFLNLPLFSLNDLIRYQKEAKIIVSIGYKNQNRERDKKINQLKKLGYQTSGFISRDASISNSSKIGENVIVLPHAQIEANSIIENNVIIWSGSMVCHDSKIGKNTFLAPRVTVCGFSCIKNNCFIGAGSVIRDHVSVGPFSVVSAGVTILNNIDSHTIITPKEGDCNFIKIKKDGKKI